MSPVLSPLHTYWVATPRSASVHGQRSLERPVFLHFENKGIANPLRCRPCIHSLGGLVTSQRTCPQIPEWSVFPIVQKTKALGVLCCPLYMHCLGSYATEHMPEDP